MAIKMMPVKFDAVGFPVVEWVEDRNSFAPDGGWFGSTRVTVRCFIKPDPESGELLFATSRSPKKEEIYQQRPWKNLSSFHGQAARELYHTQEDLQTFNVMKQALAKRLSPKKQGAPDMSHLVGLLREDDAIVMLAEFDDEHRSVPMHINYATGTQIEIAELHNELFRWFIAKRANFVENICGGEFVWPKDKVDLIDNKEVPEDSFDWWIVFIGGGCLVGLWSDLFGK
jgi:hypothetical protein